MTRPIDRAAAHTSLGRERGSILARLAVRSAATSGSSARRASTFPSARSPARRTGSSPSTTRRPTTSTLVTRRGARRLVPGRAGDHRRGRDERARTATSRRTASRSSGGAASTRAFPTGRTRRPPLWVAEPLGRRARPARDRRAVGPPVRGRPRGGGDARAARASRAAALTLGGRRSSPGQPRDRTRDRARARASAGFAGRLVARSAAELEETRTLVQRARRERPSRRRRTSPTRARLHDAVTERVECRRRPASRCS